MGEIQKHILEQYKMYVEMADRINSNGGLPDGLNQEEFFEGYSVPRNKEIMIAICYLHIKKNNDIIDYIKKNKKEILFVKQTLMKYLRYVKKTLNCKSLKTMRQKLIDLIPFYVSSSILYIFR